MITLQTGKIARCLDFILGLWFKKSDVPPPIWHGILLLKVGWITENLAELKFDLLVLESLKSAFIVGFFFISNKLWELKSIYKTKVRNSKKPCFLGCTWHFKVLGPGKFKTINWFWKVPLLWMASSWKYQWNTCTKVCGFLACFFAKMVPFVDLD